MNKNKVSQKRNNSKTLESIPDLQYKYDDLENIKVYGKPRPNTKAQEVYLDVTFTYEDGISWEGSIVIKCRRAVLDLKEESEIKDYLKQVYIYCHPNQHKQWIEQQKEFWNSPSSRKSRKAEEQLVTKPLFYDLLKFQWACVPCILPGNSNPARRYQALKDFGYSIATNSLQCQQCKKKTTHIILVPLPRRGTLGYETMSPGFKRKCLELLNYYDAYEGKTGNKKELLPEHKFPEIRWDASTRRDSLENLTDEEIKNDFQLMTNQRNLQKREVCRKCSQDDIRPYPFGIKFYYQGDERWPSDIPKTGKKSEKGCIGCGWYDMKKWRDTLNQKLAHVVHNEEI